MEIRALDHVQLAIPPGGEAEGRRFYGELLGLVEVAKPEAMRARGGAWFHGVGVIVHLGVEKDFRPARKAHPAFVVADLEVCRRELEAAGVEVRVVEGPAGGLGERFHCFDPFGNRLEFIRDGDGFSQRAAEG
ncbi:MAG: VOC family protein [Planctomycetota bacterium]|nr:VOC family protein [Planctomycetota bacterium]